jgi:predicted Zn finger-like uncharacterized protein
MDRARHDGRGRPGTTMKLAEGIRRHGFRKWYERELLQGHAHLALTFLCLVGVFAAFESATQAPSWAERASDAAVTLLCVGAGLWALRRYLHLLHHAEAAAFQAECRQCKTYGRLELLQSDASGDKVQVRCRHCSNVWRIEA